MSQIVQFYILLLKKKPLCYYQHTIVNLHNYYINRPLVISLLCEIVTSQVVCFNQTTMKLFHANLLLKFPEEFLPY